MEPLLDSSDLMECSSRLHDAIMDGNVELAGNILQSQACDVNEADDNSGRTALHLAALRGRGDLVNLLLSNGADVSACDSQGNTALHWCGHEDCIELLANHGADVLQRNKRGLTARDLAERRGVSAGAYSLLRQLEREARQSSEDHDSSNEQTQRHSSTSSQGRSLALWQELACEMGWRNFLLLLLGLLAFSLYIAYIITGFSQGRRMRIPLDGSTENFMMKL